MSNNIIGPSEPSSVLSEEHQHRLEEHLKWLGSDRKEGTRLDFHDEDLTEVILAGTNLAVANLTAAVLNGADLTGANLSEADLTKALLLNAKLPGANLYGASMEKANLSRAVLTKADLSLSNLSEGYLATVNLREARLSQANLSRADLHGSNLSQANLSHAKLCYANLQGVDLSGADLSGADLTGADLTGADLGRAQLFKVKLTGANLTAVNLSGATLYRADLTGADLNGSELKGAYLCETRLENANLHFTKGIHLDYTFIRGAQFDALGSGWWAVVCDRVLSPLGRGLTRRGWVWLGKWFSYPEVYRDRWSVLRQTYAGPRAFYLFFFVILFTIPYVGRAAFYSAVGPVEQKMVDWTETRKKELRQELDTGSLAGETTQTVRVKAPNERVTVTVEGKPVSVLLPSRDIEVPLSARESHRAAAKKELETLEAIEHRVKPYPLWKVVLRWDEGRMLPTALAVLLIVYNFGVYWLVTNIGPLRDQEERSGWSPRWYEYRALVWWHRVVSVLFYVSIFSFLRNLSEALQHPVRVWLPIGGG